ncbi:hypothetical protein HNQ41_002451 [Texcoconibacillus texcoconensis]|uniref:Uncharacterized protein n=1 Tax=Texcoconibacillus texcoconensis TaxID=1095777 RepID=A0A840QSK8_9BACI|nr:hypothetical protein [Texcoconibacillus texcoconensis]
MDPSPDRSQSIMYQINRKREILKQNEDPSLVT